MTHHDIKQVVVCADGYALNAPERYQRDEPVPALGNTRKCEFAYLAGHDFVPHLMDASVRVVRGSGKPMLPA